MSTERAELAEGTQRCALVTGGSRGIGEAIVRTLQAQGWSVAFTYKSSSSVAMKLEGELPGCAAFEFDLRDRKRPKTLVEEVEAKVGPIDGLVNNAGIQHGQLLAMTNDDAWDEVIDCNLGGTFRLCRAVVPKMVRRKRGSIVNISSLGAIRGVAGQSAYGASKAGVLALTRSLAREMGKRNLRVNAVIPGFVETDMTRDLPAPAIQALRVNEALPCGTSAQAVADAVAFLLSARAESMTGQSLTLDAGASI